MDHQDVQSAAEIAEHNVQPLVAYRHLPTMPILSRSRSLQATMGT